jgi:phosphinothricin acetyltransferase
MVITMTEMIRMAYSSDAHDIQTIYAPIVRDTAISFELEPPTIDEMRTRIKDRLTTLPWLVLESDRRIVAYAYASPHRTRPVYRWSVDVSVYVAPDVYRRGFGRRLYEVLLAVIKAQGYCTAFAGIALPNEPSIRLHEAMGFSLVGIYRNVGYKLGQWRDVGWWSLALSDYNESPTEPRKITELETMGQLEPLLSQKY